jgi:hypothetical protein
MSVGNLKDYGNKGNNFPYQLAALKLAGMNQLLFCEEVHMTSTSVAGLATLIDNYFTANPEKFLIAKTIIGTPIIPFGSVTAFLTVATLD